MSPTEQILVARDIEAQGCTNKPKQTLESKTQNDQVKVDEMGGACSTHGSEDGRIRILVGKPEGERLIGRHRRRW
jgi:hypothetical protein